jgi:7-carboxy-7-deazaguanine synthase
MPGRRYTVKSIFPTLQGEGYNTGRAAVFCRFTGCNLWTGREQDRAQAVCRFCDTDFVGTDGPGGGVYGSATELAAAILDRWSGCGRPFVVFTGGEPTLQIDAELLGELHRENTVVAIETNGTNHVLEGVDWICVSPKANSRLRQLSGDEIKVAWPQPALDLDALERLAFRHRFLQPIDGPALAANACEVRAECRRRPAWRVSTQLHKVLGLP